jgi:hypothetical protein
MTPQHTWSLELLIAIGLPLTAVAACIVTLLLALQSPMHEIVDDFSLAAASVERSAP